MTMSEGTKQQLARAKKLIQNKHYDDARAILITIDHEIADKWLERLPQGNSAVAVQTPAIKWALAFGQFAVALVGAILVATFVSNGLGSSGSGNNGIAVLIAFSGTGILLLFIANRVTRQMRR